MSLPTCDLSDCNGRPEYEVKIPSLSRYQTMNLCSEHYDWGEGTDQVELIREL